jgi:hypothetical protein
MKAPVLRERVMALLSGWNRTGDTPVREIRTGDFDLAVAKGAVTYGLARRGRRIRIRSGLSQTYYLGIAASMPAVPGLPPPIKALCVAPFGMEEGSRLPALDKEFVLMVGQPASFDFLGSTVRREDPPGRVVEQWQGEIRPISTIETTLDGEPGEAVTVRLEVEATEVGTLELWCVSKEDGRRWKLEFNVRDVAEGGSGFDR